MVVEKAKIGQQIDLVVRDKDGNVKSHKRVVNRKGKRTEEDLA